MSHSVLRVCTWCGHPPHQGNCPAHITAALPVERTYQRRDTSALPPIQTHRCQCPCEHRP